ncbi:ABC transporter permease [Allomuricauda sp. SCSIO 65647]|uniref:ABC transporter permease n=1 Tax=Allomuricauda sp. SCSIO 65647 TaxID=2908843 RepID=UPI001F35C194|nr:FtsX-like permease family protein [Muricauda sp. SCSIO 65647]UJH69105.1 FtsX-like permease family protein [Muricauda sp. SCSIO 65647]
MNFPLYIAKRYLRSKSSQNAVNIINFITFLVIIIGAAALFIVLSAFSGLKIFSLQFTNTFDPDLKAVPTTGKVFSLLETDEEKLSTIGGVLHYSKELEERVYLSFREKGDLAFIKGVDENYRKVTDIDSTLYFGNWGITDHNTVMGIGIYNLLGVPINNYQTPMMALAPKPGKSSLTQAALGSKPYNELPLVVSGVYAVEEGLDKKYIFTDLKLVQAFLEKDSAQVSGINFKLDENASLENVRGAIKNALGDKAIVLSRRELNSTLYRMLNTENLATYLIFTLVLIIALFNVVGAIIMMILDKRQNSKTLFSLGATIKELRQIYFIQGLLVTTLGGLVGVLIGILLVASQLVFGWLKITPSLAYPVAFDMMNVLLVLATITLLGIVSSKIASSRISKRLIAAS